MMNLTKDRTIKKTTLRLFEHILPNMYLGCFWGLVPVRDEPEHIWEGISTLTEELPSLIVRDLGNGRMFLWFANMREGIEAIQQVAPRWFTSAHEKAAIRQRIVNISNLAHLLNEGYRSINIFDSSYKDQQLGGLTGVRVPLDLYSFVGVLKRTNLGILGEFGVVDVLNTPLDEITSMVLMSPFWADDNTLRLELAGIF